MYNRNESPTSEGPDLGQLTVKYKLTPASLLKQNKSKRDRQEYLETMLSNQKGQNRDPVFERRFESLPNNPGSSIPQKDPYNQINLSHGGWQRNQSYLEGRSASLGQHLELQKGSRHKGSTNAITQNELSMFQSQIYARPEENFLESMSSHHFIMNNFPRISQKKSAGKQGGRASEQRSGEELLNQESHEELDRGIYLKVPARYSGQESQAASGNLKRSSNAMKQERMSLDVQLPDIQDSQISVDDGVRQSHSFATRNQKILQRKVNSIQSRVDHSLDSQHHESILRSQDEVASQLRRNLNKKEQEMKLLKSEVALIQKMLEQKEMEICSQSTYDHTSQPSFEERNGLAGIQSNLKFFKQLLHSFSDKVLKRYPVCYNLHDRLVTNYMSEFEKLESYFELERCKGRLQVEQLENELKKLASKNQELQKHIDKDASYLHNLFTKNDSIMDLSQQITEWESQKTLDQLAQECLSKKDLPSAMPSIDDDDGNVYSGLLSYLKELLGSMHGNQVGFGKLEEMHFSDNSDYIMRKIEGEINQRFKNVQFTTAKKVLRRFYRNVKMVDISTQIEEDPLQLEIQLLEGQIHDMKIDKESDKSHIQSLNRQLSEYSGARLQLQIALRQGKEALSVVQEQLTEKDHIIKEQGNSNRYLNEQIIKYTEQVKELMKKCDEFEVKVQYLRENIFSQDEIIKKKKAKITAIKDRNKGFDDMEKAFLKADTEAKKLTKINLDLQLAYDKLRELRESLEKRLMAYARLANQQKKVLLANNIQPPITTEISDLGSIQLSSRSHVENQEEESEQEQEEEEMREVESDKESEQPIEERSPGGDAVTQSAISPRVQGDLLELTEEEKEQLKKVMKEMGFEMGEVEIDPARREEYMRMINSWFQKANEEDWTMQMLSQLGQEILNKLLSNQERIRKAKRIKKKKIQKHASSNEVSKKERHKKKNSISENDGIEKLSELGVQKQKTRNLNKLRTQKTVLKRFQTSANQNASKPKKHQQTMEEVIEEEQTVFPEITVEDHDHLFGNDPCPPSIEVTQELIEIADSKTPENNESNNDVTPFQGVTPSYRMKPTMSKEQLPSRKASYQKSSSPSPRLPSQRQRSVESIGAEGTKSHPSLLDVPREVSFENLRKVSSIKRLERNTSSFKSQHRSNKVLPSEKEAMNQVSEEEQPSPTQIHTLEISHNSSKRKLTLDQVQPTKIVYIDDTKRNLTNQSSQTNLKPVKSSFKPQGSQFSPPKQKSYEEVVFKPPKRNRAFQVQTDLTFSALQEKFQHTNLTEATTQTDDFMFSLEEDAKRRLAFLVGHKLPKHGDKFDRGSSMFTHASLVRDEEEGNLMFDVFREAGQVVEGGQGQQMTRGNVNYPKHREFKPVLKQKYKEYF